MNKLKMYVLLATSFSLLFLGCSKKNSDEACQHETTMNLDSGNYDAVLASGCTDSMQRGAAYFGKAGFDVTNVLNRFIQTGVFSGPTVTTASHFTVYMTELVTKVTSSSLSDLDNSIRQYTSIPATADSFKDARFDLSIVDTVKGLSLLKSVIDASGGLGTLNTTCDMNANGKPDEIDATSCALLTSVSKPCVSVVSGVTTTLGTILPGNDISPVTFSNNSNTFTGLIISEMGTGPNSTCPSPNEYRKLLFQPTGTTSWVVVTTTPQSCPDLQGRDWPCPILNPDGTPMDLVGAVDNSLNSALNALSSSITTTTNDVQKAIQDIKAKACPTGTCSSTDIANYLQTYQQ